MEGAVGGEPLLGPTRPRAGAVVCVAEDGPRAQVVRTLEDSGYDVLGMVGRGLELLPLVADVEPDVVVLDIALVGTLGVRLLGLMKHLAPEVAIVVLAPLRVFHVAALEAGAHAVVPADDLRGLGETLLELAGSARR